MKTFEKNREVTLAASMVFLVGQRITPLVSPWSTTTRRVSKPSERGRSVMRSQEICWKGREQEDGMGRSGGQDGWVLALFCGHEALPWT